MKIRQILVAGAAVAMLAGCADYGGGYGYGPGFGGPIAYDGYYDGYYGPIYDGYWNGGNFYYQSRNGGQWRRGGKHFRRTAASGYNHIQGTTQRDNNQRDHRNNPH